MCKFKNRFINLVFDLPLYKIITVTFLLNFIELRKNAKIIY